jgi:Protein of unknown function (DUF1214)
MLIAADCPAGPTCALANDRGIAPRPRRRHPIVAPIVVAVEPPVVLPFEGAVGKSRYVIHFDKGGDPKVKAFWSVTMYDLKFNLVANPIDRYSLGDRAGMKPDADGGLTIYVQKDSPGADRESNWLPAPEGQFFMIMRTYLPADDIVNQTWQPPKIAAVGG